MDKKVRNSNLELLRILAMYMIVFIHANVYIGTFCTGTVRTIGSGLVNGICNTGVTCFILISGYYGIKFSVRKFIKMECMMITFSLFETVLLCVFSPELMQGTALLEQVVKSLLPFITRKYWFYSTYVCVFFLSGYIQKFIELLSQKELERLLGILLLLFSVFPTLFYFEVIPDNGKGIIQMSMIYMIGRYIRMYKDIVIPKGKAGICFLALWAINSISHVFPLQVGPIAHHFCKDNSITNIIISIILFYFFKEIKIQSGAINKFAANIFAVFALNYNLVNIVMNIFIENGYQSRADIGGFGIFAGVVLVLMLFCILTGFVREMLLGRLENKLNESLSTVIMQGCTKLKNCGF